METMFSIVDGTTTYGDQHRQTEQPGLLGNAGLARNGAIGLGAQGLVQRLQLLRRLVKLRHGLGAHAVGNGGRVVTALLQLARHMGKLRAVAVQQPGDVLGQRLRPGQSQAVKARRQVLGRLPGRQPFPGARRTASTFS